MPLLLLLGLAPALAADEEPPAPAPAVPDQAEYNRLSQELEKLAARNAWAGVERTWAKLEATHVTPTFDDWVRGAHAARALGDMGGARERLAGANERKEDREVLDWLWEIDSNYGQVWLACDEGADVSLEASSMPFNPDMRRAIEFAQEQVEESCLFEGYLPEGTYTFHTHELKVLPRVQTVKVDLRGAEIPKKKGKKKKSEG